MNVDWIPCSEMMPEIGREVLFIKVFNTGRRAVCKGSTRENPRGFVEWFSCDTQQFDFKDYTFKWSWCPARYVTHWMPLPDVPESEE